FPGFGHHLLHPAAQYTLDLTVLHGDCFGLGRTGGLASGAHRFAGTTLVLQRADRSLYAASLDLRPGLDHHLPQPKQRWAARLDGNSGLGATKLAGLRSGTNYRDLLPALH